MNSEFLQIIESLLQYVNSNNIEEFSSMLENLVSLVENLEADIKNLKK